MCRVVGADRVEDEEFGTALENPLPNLLDYRGVRRRLVEAGQGKGCGLGGRRVNGSRLSGHNAPCLPQIAGQSNRCETAITRHRSQLRRFADDSNTSERVAVFTVRILQCVRKLKNSACGNGAKASTANA